MKRTLLTLLVSALVACPLAAGTRNCNATLASGTCNNICSAGGDALLYFSISQTDPDGAGPLLPLSTRLVEALAWAFNYQEGAETKVQFAERVIRENIFRELILRHDNYLEELAKQARLAANPPPSSVGN